MSKTIFVVLALFMANFAQAASVSCVGSKPVPSLRAENIVINFHEIYLEKINFELNSYMGSTYKKIQGKLDSEKQIRSFEVSTLGMFDRSFFQVEERSLIALRGGATEFAAVITIQMSGNPKVSVNPVRCVVE